jgi:hypothetical protein
MQNSPRDKASYRSISARPRNIGGCIAAESTAGYVEARVSGAHCGFLTTTARRGASVEPSPVRYIYVAIELQEMAHEIAFIERQRNVASRAEGPR